MHDQNTAYSLVHEDIKVRANILLPLGRDQSSNLDVQDLTTLSIPATRTDKILQLQHQSRKSAFELCNHRIYCYDGFEGETFDGLRTLQKAQSQGL